MPRPDFVMLRERLLDSGIASRHARRIVLELEEHYADLVDEARRDGASCSEAETQAMARLGKPNEIVAQVRSYPELRSWAFRNPRAAAVFYPLACLAALPAAPLIAGIERAPQLARWGMSLVLAGVFTAALLLVLQLSIVFG